MAWRRKRSRYIMKRRLSWLPGRATKATRTSRPGARSVRLSAGSTERAWLSVFGRVWDVSGPCMLQKHGAAGHGGRSRRRWRGEHPRRLANQLPLPTQYCTTPASSDMATLHASTDVLRPPPRLSLRHTCKTARRRSRRLGAPALRIHHRALGARIGPLSGRGGLCALHFASC